MAPRHLKKQRGTSTLANSLVIASIALAFVAVVAALAANLIDEPVTSAREAEVVSVAPQQPVSQVGKLIAVTPTSVTAESTDGFARTYAITPETNAITAAGSAVGGTATAFSVDDEVSIVGVLRDGRAVATAVAHQQVSNLDGPPMDGI